MKDWNVTFCDGSTEKVNNCPSVIAAMICAITFRPRFSLGDVVSVVATSRTAVC